MSPAAWDPAQYERFRSERMLPCFDLIALIRPLSGMRIVDLGCGNGELTALLVDRLPDAQAEGLDSSEAMLAGARKRSGPRLSFRLADIAGVDDFGAFDLVFSNAALHWVPDNEALMERLLSTMKPGAQIAVQLPKNEGHASHRVARALAGEAPFSAWLDGFATRSAALDLERYAELLAAHGFVEQVCCEKIYGHTLARSSEVAEWTRGTLLVPYLSRLDDENKARFMAAYRARLLAEIGDRAPYFFAFRRLLFWGVKG